MRYLSVCSGIEAASAAWHELGWTPVAFAEIEPFCAALLQHHYPTVPNLGDFTQITSGQIDALGGIDLLVGGTPCFPAGTSVLTQRGFMDISEVQVGDEVYTHVHRWRRVTDTMSHSSPTVLVRGQGHPGIVTTSNHPFYARRTVRVWNNTRRSYDRVFQVPEWMAADDLKGSFWASPAQFPHAEIPPLNVRPHEQPLPFSPAFLWVVGAWLGDGWVRDGQRPDRSTGVKWGAVIICTAKAEADSFASKLVAAGLTFTQTQERTTARFTMYSKPLARWLTTHFGRGAAGKHVPAWVLGLSEPERRALLEGYCYADGWHNKRQRCLQFTSINKNLLVGIRLLGLTLGYNGALHLHTNNRTCIIEGRRVNEQPAYLLRLFESSRSAFQDAGFSWGCVRSVESTGRIETVYNLEVEEDHSYVADGLVVHNCQDYSVAGNRAGLAGARGNLTLDFCALAHTLGVPHVVWENVPGVFSIDGGRTFARIIGALTGWEPAVPAGGWRGAGAAWGPSYALAWRVLDAQYFGVPQRRRRVFLVARQDGDWRACVAGLWHLAGAGDWFDHALRSPLSLGATIGAYAPAGWRKALAFTACDRNGGEVIAGGCVTLRMAETPAPGPTVATKLFDVLETHGSHLLRYMLSPEACRGILNRARRRGKNLPPVLDAALHDGTTRSSVVLPNTAGTLGGTPASGNGGDLDRMTYVPIPILEVTARAGERAVTRAGLGVGVAGAPMYTLEATHGHGVAHTLTTEYDASPDGTGRGVPIIPACAPLVFAHQSSISTNQIVRQGAHAGALGVTRQDAVLAPVVAESMSGADAPVKDAPRPSVASPNQRDVLAYTVQTNDGGAHRRADRPYGGMYVRETDAALTVGTTDQTVIAFTACDHGADAGAVAPTLRAAVHAKSHANGGAAPAVVYQQHGSDVGPIGTLRAGNGTASGGVPFLAVLAPAITARQQKGGFNDPANDGLIVTGRTVALRGRAGALLPELGGDVATALRSDQGGGARAYVLHDADCEGCYAPTREELALPLQADTGSGVRQMVAFAQNERAEVRDLQGLAGALAAEPGAQQQTYVAIQPKGDGRVLMSSESAAAITTADHARWDTPMVAFELQHQFAARMMVRRLTPLECERLQGFPDQFTNIPRDGAYTARAMRALKKRLAKHGIVLHEADLRCMIQDGPRYRALGNSMAVPCMAWIGQSIVRTQVARNLPVLMPVSASVWRWHHAHVF